MSIPQKKRNLIVNYIPSHLKEEQLYDLFASAGSIKSLRIMRNADGSGKGYGFVEFQEHASARKAIMQFDGLRLGKKKLKVAFARPGGSREGCNLFVKNLPTTWTTDKLTKEFEKFGELLESRVLSTNDSQSRLCGFVRFDLPRDAHNAMESLNGFIPEDGDFQIKISHATKRASRYSNYSNATQNEASPRRANPNTLRSNPAFPHYHPPPLHHGNSPYYPQQPHEMYQLPHEYSVGRQDSWGRMSEEASVFDSQHYPYGPYAESLSHSTHADYNDRDQSSPRKAHVEHSSAGPTVLGYASQPPLDLMETTSTSTGTQSALQGDVGTDQSEQEIKDDDKKCRVMLFNLPTFLEELHLKQICEKYGKVAHIKIQRDNNGHNLGCAEITFETPEARITALSGLNGCIMCNKNIVCT